MTAIDDRSLELWLKADRTNLSPELADLDALLTQTLVPAVFLSKVPTGHSNSSQGCWLGGRPKLPEHIDWPWVCYGGKPQYPMNFIGQFDLARIPECAASRGLPKIGTLFFFASYIEDVEHGNSAVIYLGEDVSDVPLRTQPPMPETLENVSEMLWWSSNPVSSFDYCPVGLIEYQAIDPNALLAQNGSEDHAAYQIACRAYALQCKELQTTIVEDHGASDRLLNWFKGRKQKTEATADTMHRLLSGDTGYETVARPNQNLVRLLTVDHDPDWGFEYASGTLAFFIRADDLENQRFSAAFAMQE